MDLRRKLDELVALNPDGIWMLGIVGFSQPNIGRVKHVAEDLYELSTAMIFPDGHGVALRGFFDINHVGWLSAAVDADPFTRAIIETLDGPKATTNGGGLTEDEILKLMEQG